MKDKKIIIVALIMAVISLSVGFAAFSSTLTISSSATVTPNSSDFKVIFSSSETSAATTAITPSVSGATASNATVTGTKLSNISVAFTEPGQRADYAFYVRNDGQYDAYLNNVNIGSITCTPGTGATKALVDSACEGIKISVTYGVGGTGMSTSGQIVDKSTSQTNLTDYKLISGEYVYAIFRIMYNSGSARADGPFTVTIGDTTFDFSTVD